MRLSFGIWFAWLLFALPAFASGPLLIDQGRVVISADGNEHDIDDWGSTAVSLALLASVGAQDQLAAYIYNDHIWGSNQENPDRGGMSATDHMTESALGGARRFGFDTGRFISAVDHPEHAYEAVADAIDATMANAPLTIVAAGPVHVIGEGISRADIRRLRYVTVVSHSWWNENHADRPSHKPWDEHEGWTWDEIREAFPPKATGLNLVRIPDQNGQGLLAHRDEFAWMETSTARLRPPFAGGNWDWLISRVATTQKGERYDVSDAGMVLYLLTGEEKAGMEGLRRILEGR